MIFEFLFADLLFGLLLLLLDSFFFYVIIVKSFEFIFYNFLGVVILEDENPYSYFF